MYAICDCLDQWVCTAQTWLACSGFSGDRGGLCRRSPNTGGISSGGYRTPQSRKQYPIDNRHDLKACELNFFLGRFMKLATSWALLEVGWFDYSISRRCCNRLPGDTIPVVSFSRSFVGDTHE